jgi:hypothetical protein
MQSTASEAREAKNGIVAITNNAIIFITNMIQADELSLQ